MRKSLAFIMVLVMVIGVAGVAFSQPSTNAVITVKVGDATINPETDSVCTDEEVTFIATTQKIGSRADDEWIIEDGVNPPIFLTGSRQLVEVENDDDYYINTLLYTFNDAGTYKVTYNIEMYNLIGPPNNQTKQILATSSSFVILTVIVCAEGDCPAAPAIANAYLNSISFTGPRGWIIDAVNDEMLNTMPATDFQGHPKCIDGEPNSDYEDAVIAFVESLLES